MSILANIDDKHVPLYRIMWVAATPHFCGDPDCQREGYYEVRLEQEEAVWANAKERNAVVAQLEAWQGGLGTADDPEW